jgi:hypothetical protein
MKPFLSFVIVFCLSIPQIEAADAPKVDEGFKPNDWNAY